MDTLLAHIKQIKDTSELAEVNELLSNVWELIHLYVKEDTMRYILGTATIS